MNDGRIRAAFHGKILRRQHLCPETLVLDELGLMHGRCRADIAVVNGCLIGYEIKHGCQVRSSVVRASQLRYCGPGTHGHEMVGG